MTDFTLRPWREADAASIARYADNAKIAANLRDVFPCPMPHRMRPRLWRAASGRRAGVRCAGPLRWTAKLRAASGLFLGSDVYRRSAELGYWLGEPFWGRDHDRRCGNHVPGGLCSLDIVRIHAEAFARNAASRRVLEKAGFALEGTLRRSVYKNGEMLDSCIYALVREEAP